MSFSAPASESSSLPFAVRAQDRADLCRVLAELFGYPDRENSEALANGEFLARCRIVAESAQIGFLAPESTGFAAGESGAPGAAARGSVLRAECTRLFWTYPRLVKLQGRSWVRPLGRNEPAKVLALYRELGLCNREGVRAPADELASELDYMGYVLRAEADAWNGGDSLSALEWSRLSNRFAECHLGPMARGVSDAILQHSAVPEMRFYAVLLRCVVRKKIPARRAGS